MSYLSRNDLERIATRVFNDYKHLPQFAGQQVDYVDPEILASLENPLTTYNTAQGVFDEYLREIFQKVFLAS